MSVENYYRPYTLNRKTGAEWTGFNFALVDTYDGYIQPVGGGETFQNGKAGEKVTHKLFTSVDVPAVYGDKVTQDGDSYIVIFSGGKNNGITNRGHHKEILCGVFE